MAANGDKVISWIPMRSLEYGTRRRGTRKHLLTIGRSMGLPRQHGSRFEKPGPMRSLLRKPPTSVDICHLCAFDEGGRSTGTKGLSTYLVLVVTFTVRCHWFVIAVY